MWLYFKQVLNSTHSSVYAFVKVCTICLHVVILQTHIKIQSKKEDTVVTVYTSIHFYNNSIKKQRSRKGEESFILYQNEIYKSLRGLRILSSIYHLTNSNIHFFCCTSPQTSYEQYQNSSWNIVYIPFGESLIVKASVILLYHSFLVDCLEKNQVLVIFMYFLMFIFISVSLINPCSISRFVDLWTWRLSFLFIALG